MVIELERDSKAFKAFWRTEKFSRMEFVRKQNSKNISQNIFQKPLKALKSSIVFQNFSNRKLINNRMKKFNTKFNLIWHVLAEERIFKILRFS